MTLTAVPPLQTDRLIDDPKTRIIVCCGAGGVGKTTTAAALGVRAAERGRKVVVLTIDPARRLAQSMGLTSLDNIPRQVAGIDTTAGGELHAMMLDMKRTFDEIVESHADPERARAILENPFYQSLSAGFAGTQEYMAMEKLGQLHARDLWDLIIVDTPPSRSALDFLDAPKRLGSFLDGRFIRVLVAPARAGGRAGMRFFNLGMAGLSMMTGTLNKLLGAGLLQDVQTFVAALDSMFGGFRTRADATYQLLQAPGTAFLVVAAPERDALREASYFVDRLAADRMPLAGLVLNRMHGSGAVQLSAERALAAAEILTDGVTNGMNGTNGTTDGSTNGSASGAVSGTSNGQGGKEGKEGKGGTGAREAATASSKNLAEDGIVDRPGGQAGMRGAENPGDPAVDATLDAVTPAPAPDGSSPQAPTSSSPPSPAPASDWEPASVSAEAADPKDPKDLKDPKDKDAPNGYAIDQLTASLLRLHAERMHVMARERRTRDRFTALHPDVPVAEVAALPGDVHDLGGLRAIGERLATQHAP